MEGDNPHLHVLMAYFYLCYFESFAYCLKRGLKCCWLVLRYVTERNFFDLVIKIFPGRKHIMIMCTEHMSCQLSVLNFGVRCLHYNKPILTYIICM